VRDHFLLLRELQHLDDRLHALQVEQHNLPQQLHPYELTCKEMRQELVRVHDDIEDTERQRRVLERDLESSQAQLVKTQNKLREVKTNKEYSAVQAEIATGAQHIAALEDQVLELMEAVEQRRQIYQIQERRVQEAAQELTAQEKQAQQTQADLARQITVEEVKRQQLVADLDAKLYAVYQRFAAQRGRQAVVLVQDGTCGGCHLKVQPQLVSEIRQQNKLITCPHCQRILLWPAE
jgi:predicted  nucleic acid-binding Zn-ribbon protein